jgi:subtilisin family serine protease
MLQQQTRSDHKKANSTYGISIDVCAPGEDILSTWIGNTYVASGGTSTAAPVVSGAAAIVKSFFPKLLRHSNWRTIESYSR